MKLLIVNRKKGARQAVRRLVASTSVIIRECTSGEEAVGVAREFRPDWVTLDLHMPGLNAFDTAAAIRQEDPSVRVVMLSYDEDMFLREHAHDAGIVTSLVKGNFTALRDLLMGSAAVGAS